MASVLRTAYVNVLPKTDEFDPELKKRLGRIDASSSGERIGKSFGGAFSGAAVKIVGGISSLFAGIQVAGFFKDTIDEAREAVKAGQLTEAVIKSTGGAAKISAGQIGDLAGALSLKTGVDDEAIQSGENLLLTFTRVRNETGKGNDIFNQASSTIVDMTAAMNNGAVTAEGLKTSTIQVGKALNDPIKGMTALSKVGVTFSDQQREQIKNFVDSGNIMGAQKVILQELATEFGGAAAAAADPAQKAQVAWGNLKEQIGGIILPLFNRFSGFLISNVIPAVQSFIAGMQGKGPLEGFAGTINTIGLGLRALVLAFKEGGVTSGGFVGAMERVGVVLRTAWFGVSALVAAFREGGVTSDGFVGVMERIGVALRGLAGFITGTAIPAVADFAGWIVKNRDFFIPFIAVIGGAVAVVRTIAVVTKVWAAAQALLNLALAANPIGIVVVALAALVGGLVYAYKNSETFRNIVDGALRAVADTGRWMWENVLRPTFTALVAIWQNVVAPTATWLWRNVLEPAFKGIAFAVQVAWTVISAIFNIWVAIIRNVVAPTIQWLWTNVVQPYFTGIGNTIRAVWDNVIKPVLSALGTFIRDYVAPAFRAGVDAIGKAWEGLRNAAAAPVRFVIDTVINKGIIGTFNKVADFFGAKTVATVPVPFAAGGMVRGPGTETSDSIPALLSRGEFVLPAKTVRQVGVGLLNRLIGKPRAGKPGDGSEGIAFADGGLVGDILSIFTDPAKVIAKPIKALLSATPGRGILKDILVAMGNRLIGSLLDFVGGGGGTGDVGKAQAFIRGQAGKPYVWASAGPGGYDCSGIVSAVWNLMHGKSPYSHTFSTMDEARYFPKGGPGVFTAAWANAGERGGGSVGHTAASLGGLLFESRGGAGVVVGPGVTSLGSFAHLGHYDQGGPWPTGTFGYNGSGKTEYVLSGDSMNGLLERVDELIDEVRRIAHDVGREINGTGRGLVQRARAT